MELFYFQTVYMYTSVLINLLYYTYVIAYTELTNCTELTYIENLFLNDTPRSEVHDIFHNSVYVMTIFPELNNKLMMIRLITS